MTTSRMLVLAALTRRRLTVLLRRLGPEPTRGRPWSCSRARRVLLACAALRTNLTVRELAATFGVSKSSAHRVVSTMTARIAALAQEPKLTDRRDAWVVDGTLIPTRDHRRAARSKNDRWSCNAQILARRRDLHIIATAAGGRGIETTPCTTEAPPSRRSACATGASSRMAATAAFPSSSRLSSAATASCVTVRGAGTDGVAPASNTPSRA